MGEIINFKKKTNKNLYIVLVLLVIATLALLYVNIVHSAYKKNLSLNNTSIMSLEDSGYSFAKTGNNIVICGQEGLTAVNKNGETVWKYSSQTNEPLLSAAGSFVLYADLNGTKAELMADGKNILTLAPYEIITAKVNKSGYCAIAAKERGYKSQVLVFNPKGDKTFAWHSTKYYVVDALVSPDNKSIFISVLDFEGSAGSVCKLLYFSFNSEEPTILSSGDGNLISSLVSTSQTVLAIGDSALFSYSKNGKTNFQIDYAGRSLQEYSVSDGIIALGLTKTSVEGSYGGSAVEVYTENGTLKGVFDMDYEISFLDVDGRKVLVNSPDGAYILSDSCRLYGNLTFENEVREGLIFSGGKKLLLVNGSGVNVYDSK